MRSAQATRAFTLAVAFVAATAGTVPFAKAQPRAPIASTSVRASRPAVGARPSAAPPLRRAEPGRLASLARGTFIDGPVSNWNTIRRNPILIGSMLTIAAVGTYLAHRYGWNIQPVVVAYTLGSYAWQLRQAVRALRGTTGATRWRVFGRELAWPAMFATGTSVAGRFMSPVLPPSSAVTTVRAVVRALD